MDNSNVLPGETTSVMARTLYLLSQAATLGVCRTRMQNVIRQLHQLADHPGQPLEIRSVCLKLLDDWYKAQVEHFPQTVESLPGASH